PRGTRRPGQAGGAAACRARAAHGRAARRPARAVREDQGVDRHGCGVASSRSMRGMPARALRIGEGTSPVRAAGRGRPLRRVRAHPGPHGGVRAVSRGRTKRLRVIVEADGGARGNPGPAGYGAVVREAGTEEILPEVAERIGVATKHVAGCRGLVGGLGAAVDLGAVEVDVRLVSKLVVEQMSRPWLLEHPGLPALAAE